MRHKHIGLSALASGLLFVGVAIIVSIPQKKASALTGFNPSQIISDTEMLNSATMDASSIQSFLDSRLQTCNVATCLKNFSENGLSAAKILSNATSTYGVNPRVLLSILESQQALITDDKPNPGAFVNAMSFSGVSGFTNQVNMAAQTLSSWTKGTTSGSYVAGTQYQVPYSPNASCGTTTITFANKATAALYSLPQFGYIPNQAALDAGLGSGDACSEYGVRNVYARYNSWFGTIRFEPTTPVYRFWSPRNQHHFYTASAQEVAVIQSSYPTNIWSYEGPRMNVPIDPGCANSAPVYRFWSTKNQTHFYTISAQEKDVIISSYSTDVWKYEGIAYCAYPTQVDSSVPLYRFWSPKLQGHFYTASAQEKDVIISSYPPSTWTFEGVAYYVK